MNREIAALTIVVMATIGAALVWLGGVDDRASGLKPQTPVAPFPYTSETFALPRQDEDIVIGGTLTIPHGRDRFPAVVLLSVAGPNDRDQSFAGHKGFMVLADRLTRAGYAVARYDDRGVGASGGVYFEASWSALANDAAAVARMLAADRRIDPGRIGFAGMSQGGPVGAMAGSALSAAGAMDPAFLILMSAPGLHGRDALRRQLETTFIALNVDPQTADRYRHLFEEYLAIVSERPDRPETKERLVAFLRGPGRGLIPSYRFLPESPDALADVLLGEWYRSNLEFDPYTVYVGVSAPVLAIGGGMDLVAPPTEHLASIEGILANAPTNDVTVRRFEGLNHLLMEAETGMPNEYAKLSNSFSDEAAATIVDWLDARMVLAD